MSLSGSNSTNFVTKYYLQVEWNAVANSAKTSYTVTANVYLISGASGYPIYSSATKYGSISIDGTSYSFSFSSALSAGQKKLIGSASKSGISPGTYITVSASAGVNITFNPGGYIGTVSVSSYETLDVLDIAAPKLSASVSDNSKFGKIAIRWSANTNCSSIQYSIDGGGSWDTASGQSGTSGSFTISGLFPKTLYSIVVCGYGSASSKWGYYSIGSVTTMAIAEFKLASGPSELVLTRDNTSSSVYIPTSTFTFEFLDVNSSKSNIQGKCAYFFPYEYDDSYTPNVVTMNDTDTQFSISLSFTRGIKKFIHGNKFYMKVLVCFDNKNYNDQNIDKYSSNIVIEMDIQNYFIPEIYALYGTVKDNLLRCICRMPDLIQNINNLPYTPLTIADIIRSGYIKVFYYIDNEEVYANIGSFNINTTLQNIDSSLRLIEFHCNLRGAINSDDKCVYMQFFDGLNTVTARCAIAQITSSNKARLGVGTNIKTRSIEFIEGLPILYYSGGYIGAGELIEELDNIMYPELDIYKNALKVNEFVEY